VLSADAVASVSREEEWDGVCVCVNCGRLICNDVEFAMLGMVLLHIWLRYDDFC
jgi:hypothetical protein